MKRLLIISIMSLFVVSACHTGMCEETICVKTQLPTQPTEDLIAGGPKGPWRRLFLDATVTEQSENLIRKFHAAKKYEGNPVIRQDKPWEGADENGGPYLYGTVMWDNGKLRMWYHCWYDKGYLNPYAESQDGINWVKPNLGIIEWKGSKENNLFLGNCQDPNEKPPYFEQGQCHNPSIIKRPWEPDPQKRYALFCFGHDYRHPRNAFSPDGLHWTFTTETREKPLLEGGDVLHVCYDYYKLRYVATWKAYHPRRGRAVGVAVSDDGMKWTKPCEQVIFIADDLDPDAAQIYGMPVFCYQGMYIGLPWIYNARFWKKGAYIKPNRENLEKDSPCTMDVQLAWSWDLINWTRNPDRQPLIPRGKKGQFDCGMIYTARAPVQVGDHLYFYYGGFDGPHNSEKSKANIGLAVMRMDGFCSMTAADTEGWLISRRENFTTPEVTINAKTTEDGYVIAEILDEDNNVMDGFSREQCIPFRGDLVHHVLNWKTKSFTEAQRKAEKKFRFYIKKADLYSYLVP